jgi:hypothetical protein
MDTMTLGPWRCCMTRANGIAAYTLTHDFKFTEWCGVRMHKIIGIFDSFEEAQDKVKSFTLTIQEDEK